MHYHFRLWRDVPVPIMDVKKYTSAVTFTLADHVLDKAVAATAVVRGYFRYLGYHFDFLRAEALINSRRICSVYTFAFWLLFPFGLPCLCAHYQIHGLLQILLITSA